MTEMNQAFDNFDRNCRQDPNYLVALLISAGILTANGKNLKKPYR